MPKLKETDRRPKRQFQPGDIVEYKAGGLFRGMEGIVTQTETSEKGEGYQDCWVVSGSREVDLYRAARDFISRKLRNKDLAIGIKISNTQLLFVRHAPESWLKGVTTREICNLRFVQIVEDD